jgi:hypothetical protein
MKDFILLLSHILNLILVFVFGMIAGVALGGLDPDGMVSEGAEMVCEGLKSKKKENKDEPKNVVQMGFHLED